MTRSTAGPATAGGRIIALILIAGAVLLVLAATTFDTFDLDRHAVPKELALHGTALLAGLAAWVTLRGSRPTAARPDLYLALYLAWCGLSLLFATNYWLGFRAFAISVSGAVCYWAARRATSLGAGSLLRAGIALAIVLAAVTGLLQAYGVDSPYFAETRAPGGTFGNRNFLAHVAAVGLPLLVTLVLGVRRAGAAAFATLGTVLITAMLFLSRSRAAWLGALAGLGILVVWAILGARPAFDAIRQRRLRVLTVAMVIALLAAGLLPNALAWRDAVPYLSTATKLLDAREGSGRGRLIQYRNTLKLVREDPVFGVGPGNWAVRYPTVTHAADPAYVPGATVPTNPWPSSDWVALLAERGGMALLLLAFAAIGLAMRAWTVARDAAADERMQAWGAAGVAAALFTVGAFDAVLLNAAPTLLALTALGAMIPVDDVPQRRTLVPVWALGLAGLVVLGGGVRSSQNLAAIRLYDQARTLTAQTAAAAVDPGNYRLRWQVGNAWIRRGRRDLGCPHALAAAAQFPFTEAAIRLARRCGGR